MYDKGWTKKNGGRRIEIVRPMDDGSRRKKMMTIGLSEIAGFACIDAKTSFFFMQLRTNISQK